MQLPSSDEETNFLKDLSSEQKVKRYPSAVHQKDCVWMRIKNVITKIDLVLQKDYLWLMRLFIIYELILVIGWKYSHCKFYKVNHNGIDFKLTMTIIVQGVVNLIFIFFVCIYYKDFIWNDLLKPHMLIFLIISDIWIAFREIRELKVNFWIWFIQIVCDVGSYIMLLLFIPVFKQQWDARDTYIQHKRIMLIDVFISIAALYITFSLFAFMIYEDWFIEEIVKDKAHAQYANIIIENFLIFEWIHQFIEYVFWGHDNDHNQLNIAINLYQWEYLGMFMVFSIIHTICIVIRMKVGDSYLYDFKIGSVFHTVGSCLYFFICILELVASGIVLWRLMKMLFNEDQFYEIFQSKYKKLTFAAVLWIILLILQISYANLSNTEFVIQFGINLFIYPIFFMWIICAIQAVDDRREKKYFLDVTICLFWINAILFIVYGVMNDIDKIHTEWEDYMHHLIFMMIVVENSLLLEGIHLTFPVVVHILSTDDKSKKDQLSNVDL